MIKDLPDYKRQEVRAALADNKTATEYLDRLERAVDSMFDMDPTGKKLVQNLRTLRDTIEFFGICLAGTNLEDRIALDSRAAALWRRVGEQPTEESIKHQVVAPGAELILDVEEDDHAYKIYPNGEAVRQGGDDSKKIIITDN